MMEIDELEEIPRGTKRKINNEDGESQPVKRIKALDQNVVNKIAAGEIIVAPMHALKELIENAVDARATSLEIAVKDGGLKLLQITDNGHGIHHDDLPILCERFTTSKLKAFEDLTAIGTYGFRGEALASISHIAHLTVTTKTAETSCAWRAQYADGNLVPAKPGQGPNPKKVAGRGGTQITVEDLFYNVPQRQKAFRSPSEEYAKILDVVGRYAIHCANVAFSCKKHGDSSMSISIAQQASTIDRIRHVYGTSTANELIPIEVHDQNLGFKASGMTSNANQHGKKTTFLLFINHRSVESSAFKSAVQRTYGTYLPKGSHPFVYLSLEIEPQRVDVNVHPTKREVNFLNEDDIIDLICDRIRGELAKVDASRTFATQTLLSTAKASASISEQPPASKIRPSGSVRAPENNLVRTDPSERKITSMLSGANDEDTEAIPGPTYSTVDRAHMQIRLISVKNLRAEVRTNMHRGLTELFASHTFVGHIDTERRLAAIQSGTKLYVVDYGLVAYEFLYQIALTDFGNYGVCEFSYPLDIYRALVAAAEVEGEATGADMSAVPDLVLKQLMSRREMLAEYFNLKITEDGKLKAYPLLIQGHSPTLAKLGTFLMRLGPCVNWDDETECFRTFCTELATFMVPEPITNEAAVPRYRSQRWKDTMDEDPENEDGEYHRRQFLMATIEGYLFPALRTRLVATKGILPAVTEVADLKGLYRVFERC